MNSPQTPEVCGPAWFEHMLAESVQQDVDDAMHESFNSWIERVIYNNHNSHKKNNNEHLRTIRAPRRQNIC